MFAETFHTFRHTTRASAFVCLLWRLGVPTYRDVPPELRHVVVVAAEELGEPADGPLAALVHRFIALKVLVVFVD